MTKKLLLFGNIRNIEVEDSLQNRQVVMDIRKELKQLDDCYSFDLIVDNNNNIVAVYHYDYVDLNLVTETFNIEVTRLVTGEGACGYELPFPIADASDESISQERFAAMWQKNNVALGGSLGVKIIEVQASFTGMLVIFKYNTV